MELEVRRPWCICYRKPGTNILDNKLVHQTFIGTKDDLHKFIQDNNYELIGYGSYNEEVK